MKKLLEPLLSCVVFDADVFKTTLQTMFLMLMFSFSGQNWQKIGRLTVTWLRILEKQKKTLQENLHNLEINMED